MFKSFKHRTTSPPPNTPKTQMKKVAEVTGEHFLLILTHYSVEVSTFYHPSSLLQIPLRSQKKSLEILA